MNNTEAAGIGAGIIVFVVIFAVVDDDTGKVEFLG